jgi:parallel beta-helix repeat protein
MNRMASAKRTRIRVALAGLATVLILGATSSVAAARSLYVSPKGKTSAACTKKAPCKSITSAVLKAKAGDRVQVASGTYREELKLAKRVSLIAHGKAVIEANGKSNGVLITGTAAAGASVEGFTVRNATFEGILLLETKKVTVTRNTVTGNDRGGAAAKPEGECAPQGVIPGDCGEGLHLMSATESQIIDNVVKNNAGGILLTDEKGPTAHNKITGNTVSNNVLDCGITLAGHNPKAVILSTAPGPPQMAGLAQSVGGVYSNVIDRNTVNGNGTKGQGGGVLLAAGPPGAGVYNNTVTHNKAEGNGLAGITLHSHAPGQDLDGNDIGHNIIGKNGVNGYPNGAPGDSDAGVSGTVGILLWSAVTHLSGTSVSGNTLSDDHFGIWTKNVPPTAKSANTFSSTVTVHLFQS